MTDMAGKVALVTGGGTGIGRGIALGFARAGMKLALAGLETAPSADNQYLTAHLGGYSAAEAVAAEIGGGAFAIDADVADTASVDAMFAQTVERFGRVDVAVNAAGVITARPIAEMSEAEWDNIMDVKAKGTFLVNRAAVIRMRAQGCGGRIINIASIAGKFGSATLTHYCASKFAVVGFTNALAKEVAREGITVNCICPRHRGHADVDAAQRRLRRAGRNGRGVLCPRHRASRAPGRAADRGRHGGTRALPRARPARDRPGHQPRRRRRLVGPYRSRLPAILGFRAPAGATRLLEAAGRGGGADRRPAAIALAEAAVAPFALEDGAVGLNVGALAVRPAVAPLALVAIAACLREGAVAVLPPVAELPLVAEAVGPAQDPAPVHHAGLHAAGR